MGATRGATDAFSGVSRHVTDSVSQISLFPFQSCEYPWRFMKEQEKMLIQDLKDSSISYPSSLIVQLRKVGAKNIEAGIGCGVGFGHGFGVGMSSYFLRGESIIYSVSHIFTWSDFHIFT